MSAGTSGLNDYNLQMKLLQSYKNGPNPLLDCPEEQRKTQINKFATTVQEHSRFMHQATMHLETNPIIECGNFASTNKIIDQVIPAFIPMLALLLLKPTRKRKIKFPAPRDMTIYHIWKMRHNLFNEVIDRSDDESLPSPINVRDIHYILYRYRKPVAEFLNGNLTIHNAKHYKKCLDFNPLDLCNETDPITHEMIDKAIKSRIIPEIHRETLMNWVGVPLNESLLRTNNKKNSVGIYGNVRKYHAIHRKEIDAAKVTQLSQAANRLLIVYSNQERNISEYDIYDIGILSPKTRISSVVRLVYDCLKGWSEISELHINKTNAHLILKILKTIDWKTTATNCVSIKPASFMPGRDAEIRTEILRVLPREKSHQVFLKTINPSKLKDPLHWLKPQHYTCERAAQHFRAIAVGWINANTLSRSERLPGSMAVKGGTCMGKSTFLLDFEGVTSPDNIKWFLRHPPQAPVGTSNVEPLLNSQVHEEGKIVYQILLEMLKKDPRIKYIIDERLITAELLLEKIIYPSQIKGHPVSIKDLETTSIVCPMLRMLKRSWRGKDPTQTTDVIVRGYKESLRNRKGVIDVMEIFDIVEEYQLYLDGKLIVEKSGKKWIYHNVKAFKRCVIPPAHLDAQVEREISQEIDETLIDTAIRKGYIEASQKNNLMRWIGYRLRDAVDMNAFGHLPLPEAQGE